jgi:PPOX class probable F420-dependent enzyme
MAATDEAAAALRRRAEAWPVARLATVSADGVPHLVPCCFAVAGDVAYSVVDHKPKRSPALRRLDNIRANPAVCLLVDHYDHDWSQLWWVRFDGGARLLTDGPEHATALARLCSKYEQYRTTPPSGTVVALDITAVRSWSASPVS